MPRRFHYVDLLRGLSALAVLVCHYRWFFARGVGDWRADAPLPLYSFLWPLYEHGGLAVQMFWVLSGFVFTVAYGAKGVTARAFWVHRVARLYPLHLLTLLVMAALETFSLYHFGHWTIEPNNDLPHFALHLFFASNWFTMEPSFNGPIWSVSVEVLIYFAFLLYMARAGLNLLAAIGLAIVGAAIALATESSLAQCLSLFFAGVTIGILTPRAHQRLGKLLLPVAGLLVLAAAAIGFAAHLAGQGIHIHTLMIYAGTPAALALFIALDLNYQLPNRFHWIGLSTYSVYLWHVPLIVAAMMAFDLTPILPNPFTLLAFVSIVAGVSVLSYRWIEAPAQRWVRSRARTWQFGSRH
jgi:peptidoglycan/LPS O-acetylase OafA/YrhL